jgi:hypothetical protein
LSAAEELTAKVEVISRSIVQLQTCDMGVNHSSILGLSESHKNLENHIAHHTVPKEVYQQATGELKQLQSMVEGLNQQVHQTKDELLRAQGIMQVINCLCAQFCLC